MHTDLCVCPLGCDTTAGEQPGSGTEAIRGNAQDIIPGGVTPSSGSMCKSVLADSYYLDGLLWSLLRFPWLHLATLKIGLLE